MIGNQGLLTCAVLDAAFEVYCELEPGFLEAIYHGALRCEFATRNLPFSREVDLPIHYKGQPLDIVCREDFLCLKQSLLKSTRLPA